MPERNYDALDGDDRQAIADYVPGYDWKPGRFGPPPGIPKARKDEFDAMTDKEYLYAFLKFSQEEKESLMVSEAERRRTYVAHWPIETIVKANDCAKEGFYYTGVADRVQCAFCGGIVRNWEIGDAPKVQHKNFFNYCKIVQNKPCQNIPINDCGLPKDLQTQQLGSTPRHDSKPATLGDLNINTIKPKDASLSVYSKRKETYKRYPDSYPLKADALCDAGFFYEGIGDKVKCFWCDGALEMWSKGDDPWTEHAKWYPGCTYIQQTKGTEFIKKARSQMTPDNISTADTLIYIKGDLAFLDKSCPNVPINRHISTIKPHSGNGLPDLGDHLNVPSGSDAIADLDITVRPQNPLMSVFGKRKETYKRYPDSYPVKADALCDAGFFFEGIGDKVKCFWCDGALEMWSKGDDPWTEHAKWFPGCPHTQQTKGTEFIKKARSQMTPDNIKTADTLIYNKGDVAFLDEATPVVEEKLSVDQLGGYKFCMSRGYPAEAIKKAYAANNDAEFDEQSVLVKIVTDLKVNDTTSLDNYVKTLAKDRELPDTDSEHGDTTTVPGRRINVPDLIISPNEPSDQECKDFIHALKCKICRKQMAGAVALPCGCFCLCQHCSKEDLPKKCPACANPVNGACRIFLT